jgi:hypothetical protein
MYGMPYKGDSLRLANSAYYSLEMEINVGLDVSFGNILVCKGIQEKAEEVNSTKAYVTNDETSG